MPWGSRGANPPRWIVRPFASEAGIVNEWTSSIARAYPYRADDGREEADGVADRVVRGGAADTGPETLRATWRGASVSRRATAGHHNIGFRCATDAD